MEDSWPSCAIVILFSIFKTYRRKRREPQLCMQVIYNLLFGGDVGGFSDNYVYNQLGRQRVDSSHRSSVEQATRRTEVPTSLWAQSVTLLSFIISMAIGYFAIRQALRRNQQAAGRGGGGRQRQGGQRSHSERIAFIARLIQKLPIQVHHTKEDLSTRSISELKALLIEETDREKDISGSPAVDRAALFLEKQDLIEALLGGPTASRSHDSSAESCSICCEDYSCGDLKRVLPGCGHQFHLECVDRWCFSSTEYSRPASCPMCNTELKEDA
ncbi:hypothetical protein KSW81_002994 [Nannochloris sp. 'desiccata']|nr:hypothetical protein KSW81_002994 [Chlorella desiccata (nom. nud.)]